MLDNANSDPNFLNTVITGDETWVYRYDPETKMQSSQWQHSSSLRPKKPQLVHSKVKVILTVFFDSRGVVHHEYAPQGQTITKEYYQEILRCLRDAVRCKRLDLWAAITWQLHHDNTAAHSAHLIQAFLTEHNIPVVCQAPYSPDMAACDFWLFPKMKMLLKGTRFESREDIMQNAMERLLTIPKTVFQKCFQQWRECWEKCVHYQGDYFEGD